MGTEISFDEADRDGIDMQVAATVGVAILAAGCQGRAAAAPVFTICQEWTLNNNHPSMSEYKYKYGCIIDLL